MARRLVFRQLLVAPNNDREALLFPYYFLAGAYTQYIIRTYGPVSQEDAQALAHAYVRMVSTPRFDSSGLKDLALDTMEPLTQFVIKMLRRVSNTYEELVAVAGGALEYLWLVLATEVGSPHMITARSEDTPMPYWYLSGTCSVKQYLGLGYSSCSKISRIQRDHVSNRTGFQKCLLKLKE
jgi:hypothetical protein